MKTFEGKLVSQNIKVGIVAARWKLEESID